ncbi:hypothetical protein K438DRAFT_1598307 [Mycena galopus ATCC 62051]|nr:hypothetical protein K438DRAFT_1598307 [Mycena galopus ATCC 62051]
MAKLTAKSVRDALASIPGDLDHAYDEVVQRINRQSADEKQLAWLALSWITNTKRPLRPFELLQALAVKPGDKALNPENLMDEETVLSVCAGLVAISPQDDVIRLVHYTMQTYLERIQPQNFPDAPLQISMTCLTCLSFNFLHPNHKDESFLRYATGHWIAHTPDKSIRPSISWSITSCTEWVQPRIPESSQDFQTSPVWMTEIFNLDEITAFPPPEGFIYPVDEGRRTPLSTYFYTM